MEKKIKKSDKRLKILIRLMMVIFGIALILFGIGKCFDNQTKEMEKQQAEATLPNIMEQIDNVIEENPDIYMIETNLEFKGTNFITVYVEDTWFNTEDIGKKRFAKDIRDNVEGILFEEGFIKTDDRLGIYVYTKDGTALAESDMFGDIKLKD